MIATERPPRLRRRFRTSDHIFGDGCLGDLNAQLHQFAVNPRCAPSGILAAYCSNQIAGLFRNLRTSGLSVPNLPRPVPAESLTMPANDGIRLDDDEGGTPA